MTNEELKRANEIDYIIKDINDLCNKFERIKKI